MNFVVNQKDNGVVVQWNTENEINSDKTFEIQKSTDGVNFETIASVKSKGAGNHLYDFFEIENIGKNTAYRLKESLSGDRYQVYSAKILPKTNVGKHVDKMNKLIPESGNGMIRAKYVVESPADIAIRLIDKEEKVVAKSDYKNQSSGNYLQSIDMKKFPEGQYMLTIEANEEVIKKYLVVK